MATSREPVACEYLVASPGRPARWRKTAFTFCKKQPLASVCMLILFAVIIVTVFAGQVAPFSPTKNDVGPSLEGPNWEHPFGTDNFGRDVLSRVLFGARTSLYVGIAATLLSALVAVVLGAVSGHFGGGL